MTLYAHDPQSLLPLLESFLPYSVCIVGSVYTTLSSSTPLEHVYTNFPPSDVLSPPSQWLAAVALPSPATQVRVFHTLEAEPRPDAVDVETARQVVVAALDDLRRLHPRNIGLGAINTLWSDAVRERVDCPDSSLTATYLAPEQQPILPAADTDGLRLDHGREGDEDLVGGTVESSQPQIYSKNDYRSPAYYASRALDTTVYRNEDGTLAAWIITNLDGSLGALYTMPDYRRRGLARALVAEHMKKHSRRVRGFCHVEMGNTAAEQMWSELGWSEAWTVKWLRWAHA